MWYNSSCLKIPLCVINGRNIDKVVLRNSQTHYIRFWTALSLTALYETAYNKGVGNAIVASFGLARRLHTISKGL